jgi:hypothetical protein
VSIKRGESQSTKGRRPWTLIYYEAYLEMQDAEGREKFLKSGTGRDFLKKNSYKIILGQTLHVAHKRVMHSIFTRGHEDITTTEIYLDVAIGANGLGVVSPLDVA